MLEEALAKCISGTKDDMEFVSDRVDRRRTEVTKLEKRIASLQDTIQVG